MCVVTAVSPFHVPGHACRPDCGACCIAPSISSPIPGMPQGKPAGVRCVQLGDDLRCAIFGKPERPACCSGLQPQLEMCGTTRGEALAWLTQLETATRPATVSHQPALDAGEQHHSSASIA
ncbi:MAG TPA: YkgJ family cysteine cluster protein [Paraburkholderia sp.]|nr:YkgJ family cysteine cluster protein [Paraburkholderia sp.]